MWIDVLSAYFESCISDIQFIPQDIHTFNREDVAFDGNILTFLETRGPVSRGYIPIEAPSIGPTLDSTARVE